MDVALWMEESRSTIDQWIEADFSAERDDNRSIEAAMRYSLLAGGKRLRPQLVLASGEYLGITPKRLRPACLAVEYLHTYSLIHDDLPSMDNDDWRRGMATSHKVFGEAMAILAGDALLTEAFAKMTELVTEGFSAYRVVSATGLLAGRAGRHGLVQGQVLDLAAENQDISVDALQRIHRLKTAYLIEACVAIPAVLAGDRPSQEVLSHYGRYFGLAFQMVDDILNVVGDATELGKATGTDAGLGKATYPRLVGMDRARALLMQYEKEALTRLNTDRGQVLSGLLTFSTSRKW